ncbi:hypothetical protein BDZ97DRAFT_1928589 [Flammula alnicola]|nr:hypothetical protein BDZ97DRAFT_1928589 [Flammula alnicola]
MQPKTPRRQKSATQASSDAGPSHNVNVPSATPASTRKTTRTNSEKMATVLAGISDAGWTVPTFLNHFLNLKNRTEQHERMLTAMLNGTSKPHLGTILQALFEKAESTSFRADDTSMPPGFNMLHQEKVNLAIVS